VSYDHALAERIRHLLAVESDVTERKMFGGLALLLRGHMTVVASGTGGLMIRADPDRADDLVASSPAVFAEMRGMVMKGWLRIDSSDVDTDNELETWVEHAVSHASTLPAKR